MKKNVVRLQWSPEEVIDVGQLAETDRRVYFEFAPGFLERHLDLSTFKLPRRSGLIEHTDRAFGPLPGLFDDSLPDGWGLILMDRMFRKRKIDPAVVSPLDRLSYVGTRAMGALTFHPPNNDLERDEELLNLYELGQNARAVLAGEATAVLPQLMRAGGSPGGARPKVLVGVQGEQIISGETDLPAGFDPWIVKFTAKADGRDAGRIEFAYAAMARAAGIHVPETRLLQVEKGNSYFAVRRFDRGPANQRLHVHTFGNLIQTNFRIPSTDYVQLLKVTLMLTRNRADVAQAFRQMAFNIAAHNRDDHAKNFAFIMNHVGEWSLSPAYDLTHSAGPGGEHTMTVAGEGRAPNREHALEVAEEAEIERREAIRILGEVNAAITGWPMFADEAGCSQRRSRAVAKKFAHL
jgi:serine/threonine-protein kinase HipA